MLAILVFAPVCLKRRLSGYIPDEMHEKNGLKAAARLSERYTFFRTFFDSSLKTFFSASKMLFVSKNKRINKEKMETIVFLSKFPQKHFYGK